MLLGALALAGKLVLLAIALAVLETVVAKLRPGWAIDSAGPSPAL